MADTRLAICVDFDRVLHDIDHPLKSKRMGPPMPGAVQAMQELEDRGFTLIIYTLRNANPKGAQHIRDWLEFYGIPHHLITAIKPDALIYIDDKGFRFTDWAADMPAIYEQIGMERD